MIETFDNKAIYLDTAPLIYYLEKSPVYFPFLEKVFKKNESGDFTFFTSSITLSEVLILPYKLGNLELIDKYEFFLTRSPNLNLVDVSTEIAKLSARLRSEYSLKLPDAIHIATAILVKADGVLSNDLAFQKIKGLNVISVPNV